MRINDMLLEATHPLFETVLPSYHPAVRLGEDLARTLTEAALTVDQIAQLFAQVEKDVTAGGNNRTKIGKGVDAAVTLKKIYDKLKDAVKKSGPISGFDKAFNAAAAELKNATGGDTGVMRYIDQYRAYAKETPEAQAVLYSALVIGCGIAGYMTLGPAGAVLKPAIVGTLKFVDKLVQGEDFSTAAAEGIKTFAAAEIFRWAGSAIKTIVGGGNPVDMPAAGTTPEPTTATAVEPSTTPEPTAATAVEPSTTPEPTAAATEPEEKPSVVAAKRSAAMQAVADKADTEPETSPPAATPAQNAYEKLSSDPKILRVISAVEKQIGDEMKNYKGKDYLEHFRKLAANKLEVSLPNDLVLLKCQYDDYDDCWCYGKMSFDDWQIFLQGGSKLRWQTEGF
jgi:hypothetical protein